MTLGKVFNYKTHVVDCPGDILRMWVIEDDVTLSHCHLTCSFGGEYCIIVTYGGNLTISNSLITSSATTSEEIGGFLEVSYGGYAAIEHSNVTGIKAKYVSLFYNVNGHYNTR